MGSQEGVRKYEQSEPAGLRPLRDRVTYNHGHLRPPIYSTSRGSYCIRKQSTVQSLHYILAQAVAYLAAVFSGLLPTYAR